MSVRPSEVAEGAQRFSLRRVFKALEASSSEELPAPTAGSTAAFAPPATACSAPAPAPVPASATPPSLTVDLGLRPPTKAHAPLLALSESTSRLKFSLPNMTPPPSRAPGGDARVAMGAAASNKRLPAGYVAGGAALTSAVSPLNREGSRADSRSCQPTMNERNTRRADSR